MGANTYYGYFDCATDPSTPYTTCYPGGSATMDIGAKVCVCVIEQFSYETFSSNITCDIFLKQTNMYMQVYVPCLEGYVAEAGSSETTIYVTCLANGKFSTHAGCVEAG